MRDDTTDTEPAGLLLVGHGTRNTDGRAEFLSVAKQVAQQLPAVVVQPCFLELAEPDIPKGVRQLAMADVQRVVVVPMLLFAAGHAKRDIPRAVDQAIRAFPTMTVDFAPHLGCHPLILKLSAKRFSEAARGAGQAGADDTTLLMVGRGSRDEEAIQETHEFVQQRIALTPVAHASTAFLAMAKPTFRDEMARLADSDSKRIVVQPHILFQGDLLTEMHDHVSAYQQRQEKRWIVTPHLGPDPLLTATVVDRFRECLRGS